MPTLTVLQGADKGLTYRTGDDSFVIGRTGAQFKLSDHTISRRHAEIRPKNGDWWLEDLHSSNGTYLNGVRLREPVRLKHGDQIRTGSTLMVFGGDERLERFSGSQLSPDLIDLEAGSRNVDSSILYTSAGSDQSAILAAPETAEAVHAWNMMYRIAEMIGDFLTVDEFLERVTDVVCDYFVVDRVFVLTRDERDGTMKPRVLRYRTREKQSQRSPVTTSHTIIDHVMATKQGVLCANAQSDERFRDSSHGSIHRLGLRSVICVPIIAHETIHGIMHLDCPMAHHTYTQEHLKLITAVGRLAGLAIENIRLAEVRLRTERLAAVGEAAAYLSHHVRNILQGLRSGSEILERGITRRDFEGIGNAWKMIQRNLDRIYQLTTNLLTFSKDRKPNVELAQINAVVQEAVSLVQGQADAKQVMLLTDLEDVPAAPIDVEGMHQVVVNLLGNAVSAVDSSTGRIVVHTGYDSSTGEVILSVSDNGPGIPEEERAAIFVPFHSTKGHGGTGLGLAAANKIISELRGKIEVQSPPGEGTTFVIRLPTQAAKSVSSDQTVFPKPPAAEPLDQTTVMQRPFRLADSNERTGRSP